MKNFCKTKKKINFNLKTCFLAFFILQTVFLPVLSFGAEPAPDHTEDYKKIEQQIDDISCNLRVKCWVVVATANIGYLILKVVNILLWLAYQIFELSAKLSLNYAAYSKNTATMIYNGWKITRDFMNLFFIFVILFIAISIILQLQTYGSQKALFRLIGVAIFINFSFFITQQVIVASNSMALFFAGPSKDISVINSKLITALNPVQMIRGGTQIPKEILAKTAASLTVGQKKAYCETQFLNPNNPITDPIAKLEIYKECLKKAEETGPKVSQLAINALEDDKPVGEANLFPVIITTLGGIAVILTAAFIYLAAAILFIIRTAVLWILMILSPLAFMAFALPGMENYWIKWRKTLLDQAFFAPAMMFMLYLVTKIITYPNPATGNTFLKDYVLQNNESKPGESFIFNFYLVMFYIVLLILFGLSLVVARSLGAHGASTAIKYGSAAANWTKGKAGRVATSPLRAARRVASEGAQKVAEGTSALRHFPGMKAAARAVVGRERKEVEEAKKQWSLYSSKEIATDVDAAKPRTNEKLSAQIDELAKRGNLDMVKDKDKITRAHQYMSQHGMDTKEIETYMPSLAKNKQAREKAIQNQKSDKMGVILKNSGEFTRKTGAAGTLVPNDNQEFYEKYWGGNHLEEADKAAKTDPTTAGKNLKEFFDTMVFEYAKGTKRGSDVKMDDIISGLEAKGNLKLANALKTEEGENIFKENATGAAGFVTGSQVAAQKAKQTLNLDDAQIAIIIKAGTLAGALPEDKKKATDILNAADNKRIVALLEELNATERRELRAMLKAKDPKLDQRIGIVENERNKQILGLEDQKIADMVKKIKTGSSQAEKEDVANLMNAADDKKLSAMLNKMADKTERQEVKDAASVVDPKLGQRIIKLMPELESSKIERTKIFGQMKQEDVQNFDFNGLKNRTAPAELTSILNDMIKGFNPAHLKTLAERGDNMMKEIVNVLTDNGAKTNVLDVAIKLEEPSGLNRKDLANYLISAPAVAGLLGLEI